MKYRYVLLVFLVLVLFPFIVSSQAFSDKQQMVIFTETMQVLQDYQDLLNGMAEIPGGDMNSLRSNAESIISLFINRKVMIYNDLDPSHQLSEFYELDTYLSNLILWYPDGMNVEMDLKQAKRSAIRQHEEGIYSIDIYAVKKIEGNYLNRMVNNNSEELTFRIAFLENRGNIEDFRIVGIREAGSATALESDNAIYGMRNLEMDEAELEKIQNMSKSILNDYYRCLALLGDPNEPEDEKEFYVEAFKQMFQDTSAVLYNDLSPQKEENYFVINTYIDHYQQWYPSGIRNIGLNIDSADYGSVVAYEDDKYYTYVYTDKFFSGSYQGGEVHRDAVNLIFKINFQKLGNTYSNFKIENIDRSGINYYDAQNVEALAVPSLSIATVSRKGFALSPNLMLGQTLIDNENISGQSLESSYHSWGINPQLKFLAGVDADYYLSDHIAIGSGVSYSLYGGSFSLDGTFQNQNTSTDVNYEPFYKMVDAAFDSSISLSYIGIPINIKYVSSKPKKIGFYLNAGIQINFLLSGDYKVTGDYRYYGYYPQFPPVIQYLDIEELGYYTRSNLDESGKIETLKSTTFCAAFSGGIIIPIGYFTNFQIGPRAILGLNDITNANSDFVDIFGNTVQHKPTKIRNYGIEFGISFKL